MIYFLLKTKSLHIKLFLVIFLSIIGTVTAAVLGRCCPNEVSAPGRCFIVVKKMHRTGADVSPGASFSTGAVLELQPQRGVSPSSVHL